MQIPWIGIVKERNMKFVRALFWSMIVAFPIVSFSGCATGRSLGVAFRNTSELNHQVASREPIRQPAIGVSSIQQAQHVAHRENAAAQNYQFSQAGYIQTAHRVAARQPDASLMTLGPNDNLGAIINNARGVVLLDYYADWCGPCRQQSGILHDMESQATKHGALIVKINVDQHRELASRFRVSSLPTLMLIKDGQIIERQSGIANHQKLASLLSK
jgi:thioredoxin 1